MDRLTCQLPGGYLDPAGGRHRQVELAPLSGSEEELLAGSNGAQADALTTTIIARCVRRLGKLDTISETVARDLLVADRQYLLLKLIEATFGPQIRATILCPASDCGSRIDISFTIDDIPVKEPESVQPVFAMELSTKAAISVNGEALNKITFRLPNGTDQEAVSPMIPVNEAEAAAMLLQRCVRSIGPLQGPGDELIGKLSARACQEIESRMEELAPRVELTMQGTCPECAGAFELPFDVQGFLFAELQTSRELLYREVHYLAYHYHWSEREIMAMPRHKRRKYIEVLADEIERLNHAV
jgi:hypothetical protein